VQLQEELVQRRQTTLLQPEVLHMLEVLSDILNKEVLQLQQVLQQLLEQVELEVQVVTQEMEETVLLQELELVSVEPEVQPEAPVRVTLHMSVELSDGFKREQFQLLLVLEM
jgi:hypothetical protein